AEAEGHHQGQRAAGEEGPAHAGRTYPAPGRSRRLRVRGRIAGMECPVRQRTTSRGARLAFALAATLATCLRGGVARAGDAPVVVPAARGAVDVYERNKPSREAILVHVAKDLRVRAAAWPAKGGAGPGAVLLLVVDPTTSLQSELL